MWFLFLAASLSCVSAAEYAARKNIPFLSDPTLFANAAIKTKFNVEVKDLEWGGQPRGVAVGIVINGERRFANFFVNRDDCEEFKSAYMRSNI